MEEGGSMNLKQSDQIALLEVCKIHTDTGEWKGVFTYPACGWDLVQSGLVTEDQKITTAGRATLFLLGKGEDPLPESKASIEISLKEGV